MSIFCRTIICWVVLSGSMAQASTLYKCTDATGLVMVQSDKCPKGATQIWKREITPDPAPTPEQLAAAEARRQKDADAALTTNNNPPPAPPEPVEPIAAVPPVAPAPPKSACARAHDLEDAIRNNDWLEMRDDQLQRLDDWVAQQCQDPPAN